MERSRLARDETNSQARTGTGKYSFSLCSADHEQDWQLFLVDPYSSIWDSHKSYKKETMMVVHDHMLVSGLTIFIIGLNSVSRLRIPTALETVDTVLYKKSDTNKTKADTNSRFVVS